MSNHIDLPDDDAEVVKKMIDYFYLLDYESGKVPDVSIVATSAAEIQKLLNPLLPGSEPGR